MYIYLCANPNMRMSQKRDHRKLIRLNAAQKCVIETMVETGRAKNETDAVARCIDAMAANILARKGV